MEGLQDRCLVGYVAHLAKKRKIVSENDTYETPVHSLSENIQLYSIPLIGIVPSLISALSSALELESKEQYEPVFVNDFAPSEPLQKHRYIETLKKGLPFRCLMFCYAPGSNVGNQCYVWKVGNEIEGLSEQLSRSQQTIEAIKTNLRFLYHDLTGTIRVHVHM